MADLSSSGIWRAFFQFLSFLGYGLYRLCELICQRIQRPALNVVRTRSPRVINTITKLINILFYIGVMYLLTFMYGSFMNGLFPPAVQTVGEGSGDTLFGLLSEIVVVLRIFAANFATREVTFGSVVATVIVFILATLLYVVINTLFFSILYGLLRNKLWEVDLTERISFLPKEGEPAANQLGRQLLNSAKEFLSKQTQINSLNQNPVLLALLLVVFLVFSGLMTALGKDDLSLMDVVWQIIDQIQVIPIVVSFLITYWIDKGIVKTGQVAVAHMPEGIQRAVHAASIRGARWAAVQDYKRAAWAAAHDVDAPQPDEPTPPQSSKPSSARWKAAEAPKPVQPQSSPPTPKAPPVDVDTSEQCPYQVYCPMYGKGGLFGETVLCKDIRYKSCRHYKDILAGM